MPLPAAGRPRWSSSPISCGCPSFSALKIAIFITRLRDFLDVGGPNAEQRMLRQVLFRAEFMSRAAAMKAAQSI
jgi:hypothetical protein